MSAKTGIAEHIAAVTRDYILQPRIGKNNKEQERFFSGNYFIKCYAIKMGKLKILLITEKRKKKKKKKKSFLFYLVLLFYFLGEELKQ